MLKNIKKILFSAILLTTMYCFAQDDYVLKKISFEGNKTISSGNLKRNLSLKAKNIGHVLLFWKDAPTFNEFYLEEDIKTNYAGLSERGFSACSSNKQ